jgi:hypothetical protein
MSSVEQILEQLDKPKLVKVLEIIKKKEPGVYDQIKASYGSLPKPLPIEALVNSVLEGVTGVSEEFLRNLKPYFRTLRRMAILEKATEADYEYCLSKARLHWPDLFAEVDSGKLIETVEASLSKLGY